MVMSRVLAATIIASGLTQAASSGAGAVITSDIRPSIDVVRSRGPQIFNAVHDSMRQWGASLHHNGMSFFLATVPEGVLFHHGNNNENSPDDPDWLAYEIEHAEQFARGGRGPPGGGKGPGRGRPPGPSHASESMDYGIGQVPLVDNHASSMEPSLRTREEDSPAPQKGGWLHTYRTTRPLRYIYVDGMGGGKTTMGTLDSQDYLLRGTRTIFDFDNSKEQVFEKRTSGGVHQKRTGGPMDEKARAVELCALCKDWNLSGVIRMEAGFEIIQCDFSDGLEEVQALQRPGSDDHRPGPGGFGNFELMRGLAERYHDIGSSRTTVDYSSMVSAYFFPINLTNPDPKRTDLPRLSNAADSELAAIQEYLNQTISNRINDSARAIDWQDVTDLIVGRYADRIKFMAQKTSTASQIASEINFLLTVYLDYSGKDNDQVSAAIERCTTFYLHGVNPVTDSDHLIHAAIKATTSEVCTKLFHVRKLVTEDSDLDDSERFSQSISLLLSLMEHLQWARFKSCGGCAVDEVCSIPMWPSGTKEDYDSPRCVNSTNRHDGESYWGGWGPGRGRGSRGGRPGDAP